MTSPVALITGGAIRIGRDICKKFHENGYDIVCHFNKSETAANELKSELNEIRADSCETICFDLNDHNDLENFVIEIKKKFNNLNVLINNASSFFKTDFLSHKDSDWKDLINSNLRGPFLLSKYFSEMLSKNNGSIINISDAMVNRGMKDYVIYSMAKAGLENLTKTLARELAPTIRVNAVAPGAILLPSDGSSQEDQLLKEIPLNRIGSERDISNAVFKLCEFSYMTGQILKIDGGRSLN